MHHFTCTHSKATHHADAIFDNTHSKNNFYASRRSTFDLIILALQGAQLLSHYSDPQYFVGPHVPRHTTITNDASHRRQVFHMDEKRYQGCNTTAPSELSNIGVALAVLSPTQCAYDDQRKIEEHVQEILHGSS